ncbi:MAG: phosphoglucomutase/phosphomannomutase family protein [Anaerolineae bacterium]|nr:phosphoglucomutase/phosphomannomutase family protein [Anaerolineae bacterium]RIK23514.1 MAG: phosphoglucosamine mutase [Anaerolineae bacterium]
MAVKFGTDGWRAVISEEFTFDNLRLVAQAIADFIHEEASQDPSVVIGFDTRFLSDRYAAEVARVMAANKIRALLARADTPTPAISYAVHNRKATAGVMITASHNPPRYNGVKLKASYGGSASVEQHRRVEAFLEQNIAAGRAPGLMSIEEAIRTEWVVKFDPAWAYYEHLGTLVDLDIIHAGELRVVHDAMYGAGRRTISEVLMRTRTDVRNLRDEMNPGFGGIHPEPIEKHLSLLASVMKNSNRHAGLATDGDADRIGAMDVNGQFVDPHRIFGLILRYLLQKRGLRGRVVRTVSTTRMIDRIAGDFGLSVVETPVGFNHISDLMIDDNVVMGGEESGGMSIHGHIPEGDGVLMGLLLLEVMADAHKPLHILVEELLKEYGPAQYARTDLRLSRPVVKADLTRKLVETAPDRISGVTVEEVRTSDGIKYYLDDGSWLLIRPSGTEPVLRVYAEAPSDERVRALLDFGEAIAAAER